jgi:ribosomal protein S18 acetylase RimI-like enzyme
VDFPLHFTTLTRGQDPSGVLAMMRALYFEDPPPHPVDHERFALTIERFLDEPARGSVTVFVEEGKTCGYALLVPYWSNEYGGTILHVDELFVVSEARSRGIARQFFDFLSRTQPFDAVAIALEVSPANLRAQRLYESIGFSPRRNTTLIRRLPFPPR